jgi:hypothetical protein
VKPATYSYQAYPGYNLAPSLQTELLIGFDSNFLYVAWHCYDDPPKLRANVAKRDVSLNDDYVGMVGNTAGSNSKC